MLTSFIAFGISDALHQISESEISQLLPDEYQDQLEQVQGVVDQLKEDAELLEAMKKLKNEQWENPTQEMVASAVAVSKRVINRLKTLPFVSEIEVFQECLNVAEKVIDGLKIVADAAFEANDYWNVLQAAEANPAAACKAAWAGPAIAKCGIDFIRSIAPGLDTTQETKDVENNVFGCIGTGVSAGAAIGGTVGALGGPAGAAAGLVVLLVLFSQLCN